MRIAIVYDCLDPYTVGGAERRYRSVVAQLAQRHQVTYLTRRQWNDAEAPRWVARLGELLGDAAPGGGGPARCWRGSPPATR